MIFTSRPFIYIFLAALFFAATLNQSISAATVADDYQDELLQQSSNDPDEDTQFKLLGVAGFLRQGCTDQLLEQMDIAADLDANEAKANQLAAFDADSASAAEKILYTSYNNLVTKGTNMVAVVYTLDQAIVPTATTIGSAVSQPGKVLQCGRDLTIKRFSHAAAEGNLMAATDSAVDSAILVFATSNIVASVGGNLTVARSGQTLRLPSTLDDIAASAFGRFFPQHGELAFQGSIIEGIALPAVRLGIPNPGTIAPVYPRFPGWRKRPARNQ